MSIPVENDNNNNFNNKDILLNLVEHFNKFSQQIMQVSNINIQWKKSEKPRSRELMAEGNYQDSN